MSDSHGPSFTAKLFILPTDVAMTRQITSTVDCSLCCCYCAVRTNQRQIITKQEMKNTALHDCGMAPEDMSSMLHVII